jgi:hypothetical protein
MSTGKDLLESTIEARLNTLEKRVGTNLLIPVEIRQRFGSYLTGYLKDQGF